MNSESSQEYDAKVVMHTESALLPFIFPVMVDVATQLARQCILSGLLYADDLVLMGDTIERIRNKLRKWTEAIESEGLKSQLGKAKVMVNVGIIREGCRQVIVSVGITMEGLSTSNGQCRDYNGGLVDK